MGLVLGHYSDNSVMGFSHVHRSGMGAGDWGDILIMPTIGDVKVVPESKENPDGGYRSRFYTMKKLHH